ncbi:porin family protein [Thiotrichales bacterium 19S3-7]|nr:porin family protein [Thiotrichales bacterium 19S3-7]MCF6801415.1 porin family protein [Thiotrichales bacterium 19S3-11]
MLKKISLSTILPALLIASSPAIADQEVVTPATSSSGMEAQAVNDSSQSTTSTANAAAKSSDAASANAKPMHHQSMYYNYDELPKPKRYVPPPAFHLIVGGQLGYGFLNSDDVSGYTNDDDGNIFGGVFVGGDYMWNPHFATGLQIGYYYGNDLFKYQGNGGLDDAKVKDTMVVPLLATAKVLLPWNFNIFIKGGIAYVNQDIEDTAHVSYNGVLSGGIGYSWHNWDLFAEYMYVFGQEDAFGDQQRTLPINAITLGLSYAFPI